MMMVTQQLVTLNVLNSAAEAQLAANLLEAEGIPCFIENQEVVSNLWHIGPAVGGVQLRVAQQHVEQGLAVLNERLAKSAERSPARHSSTSRKESRQSVSQHQQLVRAWKSALIGILIFPVSFYSLWLLGKVVGKFSMLSGKDRVLCLGTASLNLTILAVSALIFFSN